MLAMSSFKFAGLGLPVGSSESKPLRTYDITCYVEALCPSESWKRNLLFEGVSAVFPKPQLKTLCAVTHHPLCRDRCF